MCVAALHEIPLRRSLSAVQRPDEKSRWIDSVVQQKVGAWMGACEPQAASPGRCAAPNFTGMQTLGTLLRLIACLT